MKKHILILLSILLYNITYAQNGNIDCNGIVNGTSLTDDCGDCQQASLYNFISHTVIL